MFWQQIDSFIPANSPLAPTDQSHHLVFVGDRLLAPADAPHWRPLHQEEWRWLDVDRKATHYLGTLDGHPCYAEDVEGPAPSGYNSIDLRSLLGLANADLFAAAGRGWQIVQWHRDHQFCSRCGQPAADHHSDRAKQCASCGLIAYPRLSPCIIVLVHRGEELLLARSPQFPAGMFSTLAGFIEPGESAEQALAREVKEEVGIEIAQPRYVSSQSWPFPNNLMLGFHAEYASGEVRPDGVEIIEADWFRANALPKVPGTVSISGWLIQSYLASLQAS